MHIKTIAFAVTGLMAASFASGATIFGVTNTNNLLQFDSATPGTIDSSLAVTGIGNERVLGIDFRPSTGALFAVTNGNNLYTINLNTGAATQVGSTFAIPLNGSAFGFDFNPSIDRIRVVSETDRNYVINPNDGTITQVTNLAYGAGDPNFGVNPNVVGSAYDQNTGTLGGPTQLYGIDTGLDILVRQANSAGTLTTVGPIGIDASAVVGFDVQVGTNTAFASLLPSGTSVSNLYTINLGSGLATNLGQIDGGLNITAITVAIPEPTTLAASAAALLLARRRRA